MPSRDEVEAQNEVHMKLAEDLAGLKDKNKLSDDEKAVIESRLAALEDQLTADFLAAREVEYRDQLQALRQIGAVDEHGEPVMMEVPEEDQVPAQQEPATQVSNTPAQEPQPAPDAAPADEPAANAG